MNQLGLPEPSRRAPVPGGLRGPLAVFSWSSPAELTTKWPGGLLPLPDGAACVIAERGPGGTGYSISWGGGGGSPISLPIVDGDVYPCGVSIQNLAQIQITASGSAAGGLTLTIWDFNGGALRAGAVMLGDFVTLDTTQTIPGTKSFAVTGGGTGPILDCTASSAAALRLKMNAPPNPDWTYDMVITSVGAIYTGAWIVVSGTLNPIADGDGVHLPLHPTTDPFMVGVRSDVFGPAIVSRALGTNQGSSAYAAMDDVGNYVWGVIDTAEMQFGDSATKPSSTTPLDCRLYRTAAGAMHANFNLAIDGRLDCLGNLSTLNLDDGNLNARINLSSGAGPTTLKSFQPDGATAVGHILDTGSAYATAGALLASFRNNGAQKNSMDKDGKLGSVALQSPATVTGTRGGNAALADLLTKLASAGLIVDGSSP